MKPKIFLLLIAILLLLINFTTDCGKKEEDSKREDLKKISKVDLKKHSPKAKLPEIKKPKPIKKQSTEIAAWDTLINYHHHKWDNPQNVIVSMIMFIRTNPDLLIMRTPEFLMNPKEAKYLLDLARLPFCERSFSLSKPERFTDHEAIICVSFKPDPKPVFSHQDRILNKIARTSPQTCRIHMRRSKTSKHNWVVNPGSIVDIMNAMDIPLTEQDKKYSISYKIYLIRKSILIHENKNLHQFFTEEFWQKIQNNPLYLNSLKKNFSECYLVIDYSQKIPDDLILEQYIQFEWVKDGEVIKKENHLFKFSNKNQWRLHG